MDVDAALEICKVGFAKDEDAALELEDADAEVDADAVCCVPLGPATGGGERMETRREAIFDRHTGQVLAVWSHC